MRERISDEWPRPTGTADQLTASAAVRMERAARTGLGRDRGHRTARSAAGELCTRPTRMIPTPRDHRQDQEDQAQPARQQVPQDWGSLEEQRALHDV
ncbi:hypothetical protein UK12_06105 [Saccharothrix sp. ST-888]|nr:hypothetical protein UK12_06105 [Saccharothrix sp. ST-888]